MKEFIEWRDTLSRSLPNGFKKYANKWNLIKYGSVSENLEEIKGRWNELLGSSKYNYIGLSDISNQKPKTTIGGLCIIYSGDIENAKRMKLENLVEWMDINYPRFDQIRDTIGPTSLKNYAFVYENDFFSRLLQVTKTDRDFLTEYFKEISKRSTESVKKWIEYSTGSEISAKPIFTSDIEDEMKKNGEELVNEIGALKKNFNEKFLINMMYTYRWPKILKESGYIENESIVCAEPFQHLWEVAISRLPGYDSLHEFFEKNKWGTNKNKDFLAAAFLPTIKLNEKGKANSARYQKFNEVPTRGNAIEVLSKYYGEGLNKKTMFSLPRNPIIKDSINLLFSKGKYRQKIIEIEEKEIEYKKKKNQVISSFTNETPIEIRKSSVEDIRKRFIPEIKDDLFSLAEATTNVYEIIGFIEPDGRRNILENLEAIE